MNNILSALTLGYVPIHTTRIQANPAWQDAHQRHGTTKDKWTTSSPPWHWGMSLFIQQESKQTQPDKMPIRDMEQPRTNEQHPLRPDTGVRSYSYNKNPSKPSLTRCPSETWNNQGQLNKILSALTLGYVPIHTTRIQANPAWQDAHQRHGTTKDKWTTSSPPWHWGTSLFIQQESKQTQPDKMPIRDMEQPRNVSELRQFLGMRNQLGNPSNKLANISPAFLFAKKCSTLRRIPKIFGSYKAITGRASKWIKTGRICIESYCTCTSTQPHYIHHGKMQELWGGHVSRSPSYLWEKLALESQHHLPRVQRPNV